MAKSKSKTTDAEQRRSAKRDRHSASLAKNRGKSTSDSQSKSRSDKSKKNQPSKKAVPKSSNRKSTLPPPSRDSLLPPCEPSTMKIKCGEDYFYINSETFADLSGMMAKERTTGLMPSKVDLSKYDLATVRIFVKYLETGKVHSDVSFYSIAELIKLAIVFEMELKNELYDFLVKLSKKDDVPTLFEVLLIINVVTTSLEAEKEIYGEASKRFQSLVLPAHHKAYQKLPFSAVLVLFARCSLNVKSELQVADAMLLWLAGQPPIPDQAQALFSLLRTEYIPVEHRAFILERARALKIKQDSVQSINRAMDCKNSARVCVLKAHSERPRCNTRYASLSKVNPTPDMPLSFPSEDIIYKKKSDDNTESTKSSKSTKSTEKRAERSNDSAVKRFVEVSSKSSKSKSSKKPSSTKAPKAPATKKSKSKNSRPSANKNKKK